MENKQQTDRALQTPQEVNREKHIKFLAEERGDPDVKNEDESDAEDEKKSEVAGGPENATEPSQKEIRIDTLNEPHQRTDADDKIFDDDVDRSPTYLAEDDVPDNNTEEE